MKQQDTRYIRNCIDYILSNERDDYEQWCEENDKDTEQYVNNNHIYAQAVIAELDLSIIEETHERTKQ